MTLTYLRARNKNIIEILPRQHGKTMGEVIIDLWNLCFITRNSTTMYMNKAKADAIKNVKLFADLKEQLPIWMRENFIADKKDIDNQETKLIARRNNTIKVIAPGTDRDSADKAGRRNDLCHNSI